MLPSNLLTFCISLSSNLLYLIRVNHDLKSKLSILLAPLSPNLSSSSCVLAAEVPRRATQERGRFSLNLANWHIQCNEPQNVPRNNHDDLPSCDGVTLHSKNHYHLDIGKEKETMKTTPSRFSRWLLFESYSKQPYISQMLLWLLRY